MENVQVLTDGSNISTALAVFVALLGLIILIGNAVDALRKIRKPREKKEESLQTHQEACGKKFAADQRMLERHERDIGNLQDGQRVICAALHELLEHELHNGNSDKMRKASSDLFDYLNNK